MKAIKMRETGIYQKIGDLNYFIPHQLPPLNPPLVLTNEMMTLYGETNFALGQLNEMSQKLPDPKRFIKAYVLKEALLTSEIEGIHTTLMDMYTTPIGNLKPSQDTQLVLNYTYALEEAISMIVQDEFPVTCRVILKAHEKLMQGGHAAPGSFRSQSVKVGNLVPAPAPEIPSLMSSLEKYMNSVDSHPPLIMAGLAHVHFETIHPFLDGNGRIGRLLIVLILIKAGVLNLPILYPSYSFKKYHLQYYEKLDRVRTHGDFEGWIVFFLKSIRDSALDAYQRAKEIEQLEQGFKQIINSNPDFIKMKDTAALVLQHLFIKPITSIAELRENTGKAYNTIHHTLDIFEKHGLVTSPAAQKRQKRYLFLPYLELLEKEY